MEEIKLARRTISLLSSMVEGSECHTSRSTEMVRNALIGLTKANHIMHREALLHYHKYLNNLNDITIYNASESMIDDYLNQLKDK